MMASDFEKLRIDFRNVPTVDEELDAYETGNNSYPYTILKGLIPKSLVGKVTTGLGAPWQRSDTFFTDFAAHNHPDRILSATDNSLIICNHASHDVRLYRSDIDPLYTDKTHSAGMSFVHLLVIPTYKVYNVVSLASSEVIDEMIDHFKTFWVSPGSVEKVIKAVHDSMERRYNEIIASYKATNPATAPQRIDNLNTVMYACRTSASELARKLRAEGGKFFFGFHPHPHHSVGHLHMHVLLQAAEFRKHSTHAHDWKTIPADTVRLLLQD